MDWRSMRKLKRLYVESKFNHFPNHDDERGHTICYGDPDQDDHIVVGAENTEEDAEEACRRLNAIVEKPNSYIDKIEYVCKTSGIAQSVDAVLAIQALIKEYKG